MTFQNLVPELKAIANRKAQRQLMNTKRMRSRYHRPGNGGSRNQNGQASFNRNHVFDSNGPDIRIRGTAQQLHEKYLQHGRDALSSGDRVAAESFFQYAEHYSRILNMMNQSAQQRQQQRPQHNNGYSENNAENEHTSSSSTQEEQPQPEVVAEVIEAITEKPVEQNVTEKTEEEPVETAPVRPRRGRPARSVAAKKKLQEESN
ncbi:unnamed protein product [Commensalibacter papalotli (ex Botero et al. 2024)]|uniref:DUF4167 domain-containing protein n=2 Tax=Commensalibacter papalotli (ex Botero et al. 2024) TaxID=2972766 RepID=A0ABM9HUL3_9PROT|nr:unnamed protein product [Commensalibacter papalotli (ex Botero et al. 2024)]CAI3956795.1 unnamed protein product [Commensalibacter papalotli (ex Botero et al. 2024)]